MIYARVFSFLKYFNITAQNLCICHSTNGEISTLIPIVVITCNPAVLNDDQHAFMFCPIDLLTIFSNRKLKQLLSLSRPTEGRWKHQCLVNWFVQAPIAIFLYMFSCYRGPLLTIPDCQN